MDQPLTSSDHLGGGADEGGEAGARAEEAEGEGHRLFSFGLGRSGSAASPSPGQNSPAARCGLVSVAEIISQDLRTVVWHGSALTLLYLVVGGVWFLFSDSWTFTETVYFMTTSLLTVGYGDIVVSDQGVDRLIDSFIILVGLVTITIWATCANRAVRTIRPRPTEGLAVPDFDAEAAVRRCRRMLAHRVILLSVVIFLGVVIFMLGEEYGFITSFYWAVVTASSIGYGDVVPTSPAMRWFTAFYSIVATGTMLETLRFAGAYPFEVWTFRAEGKVYEQFTKARSAPERIAAVAVVDNAVTELLGIPPEARPGGAIGRSDVALSMLLLLNRVSNDDVQHAMRIFDKLEIGREGPPFPVETAGDTGRPKKSLHLRLLSMHLACTIGQSGGVLKYLIPVSVTSCIVTHRIIIALVVLNDGDFCFNGFSDTFDEGTATNENARGVVILNVMMVLQPMLVQVEGTQSGGALYRMVILRNISATTAIIASYITMTVVVVIALLRETAESSKAAQIRDVALAANGLCTLCLTEGDFCFNGFPDTFEGGRGTSYNVRGFAIHNAMMVMQFVLLLLLFVKPMLVRVEGTQSGGALYRMVVLRNISATAAIITSYTTMTVIVVFALLRETAESSKAAQVRDVTLAVNGLGTLYLTEGDFCFNGFPDTFEGTGTTSRNAQGVATHNVMMVLQPMLVRVEGTQSGGALYRMVVLRNISATTAIIASYMIMTVVVVIALLRETAESSKAAQIRDVALAVNGLSSLCFTEITLRLGFSSCLKACRAGAAARRVVNHNMGGTITTKTGGADYAHPITVTKVVPFEELPPSTRQQA
eukprot:g4380.t1